MDCGVHDSIRPWGHESDALQSYRLAVLGSLFPAGQRAGQAYAWKSPSKGGCATLPV